MRKTSLAILISLLPLVGATYAADQPTSEIRESSDPDKAAEVERHAADIQAQQQSQSSGTSGTSQGSKKKSSKSKHSKKSHSSGKAPPTEGAPAGASGSSTSGTSGQPADQSTGAGSK